jgi:hypothetical protein
MNIPARYCTCRRVEAPGCGYIELVQPLAKMRRGADGRVLPEYG